jgi:hypothetical protein
MSAIHLGVADSEGVRRGGLSSSGDQRATVDKRGGREPDSAVVVRREAPPWLLFATGLLFREGGCCFAET